MITYWTDAQDGATWQVRIDSVAPRETRGSGEGVTRVRFEHDDEAFETIVMGNLPVSELEHAELAALLDRARWSAH